MPGYANAGGGNAKGPPGGGSLNEDRSWRRRANLSGLLILVWQVGKVNLGFFKKNFLFRLCGLGRFSTGEGLDNLLECLWIPVQSLSKRFVDLACDSGPRQPVQFCRKFRIPVW